MHMSQGRGRIEVWIPPEWRQDKGMDILRSEDKDRAMSWITLVAPADPPPAKVVHALS